MRAPLCLEPHDLVVAKLVAHRGKDLDFVGTLLAAGLIDTGVLATRARALKAPSHVRLVTAWLDSWVRKYGPRSVVA